MLVRVALHPDCLAFDSSTHGKSSLEGMRRTCSEFGILVCGESDLRTVVGHLKAQSPDVRDRWIETLRLMPRLAVGYLLEELQSPESILRLFGNEGIVVLPSMLGQDVLTAAGHPAGTPSGFLPSSEVEVVEPAALPTCDTVSRLRFLQTEVIAIATTRDDFWTRRLGPLARNSKRLAIVDRYAAKDVLKATRGRSGHEWLMSKLGAFPDLIVRIITSSEAPDGSRLDDAALQEVFDRLWEAAGALREFELFWVLSSQFGQIAHDRHIRFGDHRFVEIDRGIGCFRDRLLDTSCDYSYKVRLTGSHLSDYRDREERMVELVRRSSGRDVGLGSIKRETS